MNKHLMTKFFDLLLSDLVITFLDCAMTPSYIDHGSDWSYDILGCLENMLVALYGCSIRTLLIDSRIHESPNHSPLSMNHAMFAFTSLGTESSPVSELKMQCASTESTLLLWDPSIRTISHSHLISNDFEFQARTPVSLLPDSF
jgi:hypothetical protein